jgi:glycosyltransferase involved in cell wall biosynthesis
VIHTHRPELEPNIARGNDVLLSVVVPCYDEQDVLPELVDQVLSTLQPAGVDVEIVLVDDGSRDGTRQSIRRLSEQDPRVTYVSFSRNFGKESAMLAGLVYSRGDAVVVMDADLQHPPHLVLEMLTLHWQGYDQVVARRTREGERISRTVLARLYYRVVNCSSTCAWKTASATSGCSAAAPWTRYWPWASTTASRRVCSPGSDSLSPPSITTT